MNFLYATRGPRNRILRTSEILRAALQFWRALWRWLRQVSGDAAYENYLRAASRRREARVLSREDFYLDAVNRRYTGVNRCC